MVYRKVNMTKPINIYVLPSFTQLLKFMSDNFIIVLVTNRCTMYNSITKNDENGAIVNILYFFRTELE